MNSDISMISRAVAADRGSHMATVAFVTSPLRFRWAMTTRMTFDLVEEVESSRELVDPND